MTEQQKLNIFNHFAGAVNGHPPHCKASAAGANAFAKMPTDYDEQAKLTQQLVTAAQNGDKAALERLCIFLSLRRLRAVQDSLCIVRRNEKGLGAGKQRGCFAG